MSDGTTKEKLAEIIHLLNRIAVAVESIPRSTTTAEDIAQRDRMEIRKTLLRAVEALRPFFPAGYGGTTLRQILLYKANNPRNLEAQDIRGDFTEWSTRWLIGRGPKINEAWKETIYRYSQFKNGVER